MKTTIEIYGKCDITKLEVDAIVNAANRSLLGGGGVDGAIHRAAGPKLLEECKKLGGANTGEAKLTKGYDLPSKYVIHAVGPVWGGGVRGEYQLLSMAYLNSLFIAIENGIKTIAFPNISTGVYRFPKKEAAKIVKMAVESFLKEHDGKLDKIIFCIYDDENLEVYQEVFSELLNA
jgi:O-acetyl-ADP-ribose deacetylase (regulator of RNase III)